MFLSHLRQESFKYAWPDELIYVGTSAFGDQLITIEKFKPFFSTQQEQLTRPQQLLKEAQSRNPQWQVKRLSTPLEE